MTKNEMKILQAAAANLTDIIQQIVDDDQLSEDEVLRDAFRSANRLWLVMYARMKELKK